MIATLQAIGIAFLAISAILAPSLIAGAIAAKKDRMRRNQQMRKQLKEMS